MITKHGRKFATVLGQAGLEWHYEQNGAVLDTLSLICRHTATYIRLHEWLTSGHPIFGGEWINKHYAKLDRQDDQLEARLAELGEELAGYVTGGTPQLVTNSLYGVSITVIDSAGIPRTREVPTTYKGYGR
jgi:hypothetical protein